MNGPTGVDAVAVYLIIAALLSIPVALVWSLWRDA